MLGIVTTLFLGAILFNIILQMKAPSPSSTPKPIITTSPTTVDYALEIIAEHLEVPWSMVFTSPTRMLIAERPGRIRVIINNSLQQQPLLTFSEVSSRSEEGLMGLAIDPRYRENKYLYASLAYSRNGSLAVKVVRLIDNEVSIRIDKTILDNIPAATNHAGSRLAFGPDEKLYITTGDATYKKLAQDKNSLAGKILRINSDGSIPDNNPFPYSPMYSMGHRNPQGIAWHPNGELYSTEHGPSLFDGPPGGDEINRIRAGENYGWPIVSHENTKAGFIDPLAVYTPAVAPASAMIYRGTMFPQFQGNLFFGGLRGEGVYRVVIDDTNHDLIIQKEKLSDINVGRVRDIIEGPDGSIYFSTSNRDGRGKPDKTDDKIIKLIPR